MKTILAGDKHYQQLNEELHTCPDEEITITDCAGQRYIGAGLSGKKITIDGIPGNALGAYLDGSRIEVMSNAQDATGDTMNAGEIVIHGRSGDATGYAMRGGIILVQKDVGYRAGIHMKAYEAQSPVLVVGGEAGSFLGEYQAGGCIIVLGLNTEGRAPVGNFCAAGMHGGKIFLRTEAALPFDLPEQVNARHADDADLAEIRPYIEQYCQAFGGDPDALLRATFQLLSPDSANPYKRLYVTN